MKTLVILFASSNSLHVFDRVFDGTSAFERSLAWAASVKGSQGTVILADAAIEAELSSAVQSGSHTAEVIVQEKWTLAPFFNAIADLCDRYGADSAVYAWADQPFLDSSLTKTLCEEHEEYGSEYTSAEGYVLGVSPEVISAGTCRIVSALLKERRAQNAPQSVLRTSVFDFLKLDINSYDIETHIAEEDYRLFRIQLNCGTKQNLEACRAVFQDGAHKKSAAELSEAASRNPRVLKTFPSFYNIQITDKVNVPSIYRPASFESADGAEFMALSEFKALIKKISLFSESAVIGFSLWGEPSLHPEFAQMVRAVLAEPGLSVLIETDGLCITEELCAELKDAADAVPERFTGGEQRDKIAWIVSLDAATEAMYARIHGNSSGFARAQNAVALLSRFFIGAVYPQLVRMNENEEELEPFFRFWSAKESPSGGKLIIQKYDSLCGVLPDRKPCDLSPLERNPCWHIRRDMSILQDGTVLFCRCMLKNQALGNAFADDLCALWEKSNEELCRHMNGSYSTMCGKCDEYYTFNF